MGHCITAVIRVCRIMVTTIHVLHITVMLAVTRILTITHIAGRSLQRLRCEQYKNGQKNVFHNTIIHLYAFSDV